LGSPGQIQWEDIMKPIKVWKVLRKKMQDELADGHAHAPRVAEPLGQVGEDQFPDARGEAGSNTESEIKHAMAEQLIQKCQDKKFMHRCTAFMEKTGNNLTGNGISNTVLKRLHSPLNAAVTLLWSEVLCNPVQKTVFVKFFDTIMTTENKGNNLQDFFKLCFDVVGKAGHSKSECVCMCGFVVCFWKDRQPSTNEMIGFRVPMCPGTRAELGSHMSS
jgi:hypothetical protein